LKKLLYITVNSKPEELSASKIVGRGLVDGIGPLRKKKLKQYKMLL